MEVRSDVGSGLRITFPPTTRYVPPSSVEVSRITGILNEDFEDPERVYRTWMFSSEGGFPNWWVQRNDDPICCDSECVTPSNRGMEGNYSLAVAICNIGVWWYSRSTAATTFQGSDGVYRLRFKLSLFGRGGVWFSVLRFECRVNGEPAYIMDIDGGTDLIDEPVVPVTLYAGINFIEFELKVRYYVSGTYGFRCVIVDGVRIY